MSVTLSLKEFYYPESTLCERLKEISVHIAATFKDCLEHCFDLESKIQRKYKMKIESVLDFLYEELNTGHWSEVPPFIRQTYTLASFVKAIILLQDDEEITQACLKETLHCVDLGLLLGSPLPQNPELLSNTASFLANTLKDVNKVKSDTCQSKVESTSKKRKYADNDYEENYISLNATEIKTEKCPSLQYFNDKYFITQKPVKLQDCISHWPAMKKWCDISYLLKIAGDRTVPIEIGSHYVDENWSQKLMTISDFVKTFFDKNTDSVGYLAQHNLFDQITELKNDVCIPEYCCLSRNYDESSDPDINAWFGPEGTVSPLHFDPKDNLLTQVFGTKQILLFCPEDSSYLYPHEDKLLFNTSQVNPVQPDLDKFPEFSKANMYKCLLQPGEMLYIPPKWWHHVTALDKSFSVSFWWK